MAGDSDKASAPVDDLLDHSFKAGFPQIYLLGNSLVAQVNWIMT
jgi:hypothetical protein